MKELSFWRIRDLICLDISLTSQQTSPNLSSLHQGINVHQAVASIHEDENAGIPYQALLGTLETG